MEEKFSRESCIRLLTEKSRRLSELGEERLPKRSDFSEEQVVAIKARLGPWPRALEAAGLKPAREGDRLLKNREKRRRAKLARREMRENADRAENTAGDK